MALRHADPEHVVLLRLGRPPNPLAWPHPAFRGDSRYDDPRNEFGVLYASEFRLVCFLESLDLYRPHRALLQRLAVTGVDMFDPQTGEVPDGFYDKLIGRFRLDPGQQWLDLRISTPETAVALSREPAIAAVLPELGYGSRFKPGDLLGSDRRLTQMVARWAYDHGYAGLTYSCSHRPHLDCWAIFEGASCSVIGSPAPIDRGDPDVIAVAREFELTISFARRA